MELFDVLAVDNRSKKVRFMGEALTKPNAEGVVKMAIARRGLDVEHYVTVPKGTYQAGDTWPK